MAASKERRAFLDKLKATETANTKVCTGCDTVLPDSEFHKNKNARKELASRCKKCNCARSSAHSKSEAGRECRLQRIYGLSTEQFDAMLESQNHQCAICGSQEAHGRWEQFHIDHNHATDKVRGLLCNRCNTLLGMADDQIAILLAAVKYLEESR
jgi:hypothetical protein